LSLSRTLSRSFLAALALLGPACSAALEVVATADDRGAIGGELSLQLGLAVASLPGGGHVEQTSSVGAAVIDGALDARFAFGAAAVDRALTPGVAHRLGLELEIFAPVRPGGDSLLGLALSWSPLFILGTSTTGLFGSEDRLGPTFSAARRFDPSGRRAARTAFSLGARLESASRLR